MIANEALWKHSDSDGDRITVVRPPTGGFTLSVGCRTHGQGAVWLTDRAARALSAVLAGPSTEATALQHQQCAREDGSWGSACGWEQDKPHAEHVAEMAAGGHRRGSGMTDPAAEIWTTSEGVCACDDEWLDCGIHVHCDSHCRALVSPAALDEWRAAAEHWRSHGYISGCSHGR